jgi:hypothetical protein
VAPLDGNGSPKKLGEQAKAFGIKAYGVASATVDVLAVWLMSVLLMLVVPSLPIAIEFLKTDAVGAASYLITGAVFSATFAVSAEHNIFRVLYILVFLTSLLLVTVTLNSQVAVMADHYAGILLLAVMILHATERFIWHVIQRRSFPEWLNKAAAHG